jgi:hypothetical protein
VDVLEQHAEDDPEAYFWFDLFINKQHDTQSIPQSWWKTTFMESIRAIGAVLLVLSPWDNPVPVTRAWCLWEIMSALQMSDSVRFVIKLPLIERKDFEKAFTYRGDNIVGALTNIQAEKADAFLATDKEMIFQTIHETVGFQAVNARVKERLRKWYVEMLNDTHMRKQDICGTRSILRGEAPQWQPLYEFRVSLWRPVYSIMAMTTSTRLGATFLSDP